MRVGKGALDVMHLMWPIGAKHNVVRACDGNEVLECTRVVGDAVVVNVAQVIGRFFSSSDGVEEFQLRCPFQIGRSNKARSRRRGMR